MSKNAEKAKKPEETRIVYMDVADLKDYEKNPRKNRPAVDKVAASIREFGFKVPVVIDRDRTIVCGHTRVMAARKLKIGRVPCIVAYVMEYDPKFVDVIIRRWEEFTGGKAELVSKTTPRDSNGHHQTTK